MVNYRWHIHNSEYARSFNARAKENDKGNFRGKAIGVRYFKKIQQSAY